MKTLNKILLGAMLFVTPAACGSAKLDTYLGVYCSRITLTNTMPARNVTTGTIAIDRVRLSAFNHETRVLTLNLPENNKVIHVLAEGETCLFLRTPVNATGDMNNGPTYIGSLSARKRLGIRLP